MRMLPFCGGNMGNFSSCTAGFNSVSSSPIARRTHPDHVARVLLIDGSMLKFRAPIKVVKLLLDYPNHLICPLDSLAPGLHSLSSLLPDEKLQLGRLYLLLPFKSNVQESCMKSKQALQAQKRDHGKSVPDVRETAGEEQRTRLILPGPAGDNNAPHVGLASCANLYKKGDLALCANKLQSAAGAVVQQGEHACSDKKLAGKCDTGQQRNLNKVVKWEVGSQDCAGDVGVHGRSWRAGATSSYGKLSERRRGRRETRNKSVVTTKEGQSCDSSAYGVSPLCDTPELQRAYRSFLLRRSCSWTPRLQPILERR